MKSSADHHRHWTIKTCAQAALMALGVPFRGAEAARSIRGHRPDDSFEGTLFGHKDHIQADASISRHVHGCKNICIVSHHASASDDTERNFLSYSADNHVEYSTRHNYSYWRSIGRISGASFVDRAAGELTDLRGGGLYWQKLSAMAAAADRFDSEQLPICRWLMWIDPDAIFTNFQRTIEQVIGTYDRDPSQRKDIILARETAGWRHNLINSGVFFVKNSWHGRAFLEGVARTHDLGYKDATLADQDGLVKYAFFTNSDVLDESEHSIVLARARPEVAVAPQRLFNSFYWTNAEGNPTIATTSTFDHELAGWHSCDYVGHLAGVKPEAARLSGMEEMTAVRKTC